MLVYFIKLLFLFVDKKLETSLNEWVNQFLALIELLHGSTLTVQFEQAVFSTTGPRILLFLKYPPLICSSKRTLVVKFIMHIHIDRYVFNLIQLYFIFIYSFYTKMMDIFT